MDKWLACAATPGSGVRHRFLMLSSIKHFADARGYSVCMLWGLTQGVSFCRYEELFAPIPGIKTINISAEQLSGWAGHARSRKSVRLGNRSFRVFRSGVVPGADVFSWDLKAAWNLSHMLSDRPAQVVAKPSATIRAQADAYARAHGVTTRLGIRVRVEEYLYRNRKPHRIRRELDEVLQSIIRIPWYTRVFIATDSEYVQQMLASHFKDARYLPKNFDLQDPTGRYVHRQDKAAMFTFLREVDCLCRCKRIINIGRFLNDHSVRQKWIPEPYCDAVYMHLIRR
jgi:hypothetical protein